MKIKKRFTTYREFFDKQDKKTRFMILFSGFAILLFIVVGTSLPVKNFLSQYFPKYFTRAATTGYGSGGYSESAYGGGDIASTATPVPTTPVSVTNLLLNPGFESGLLSWDIDSATSTALTTSTRTGSNAVRVGSPSLGGYVGQFVALEPGKSYTATAWVQKSAPSTVLTTFGPVFRNGSTVIGESTVPITDSFVGGYAQATSSFTVPLDATSTQIGLYVDTGNITVDLDDVQVYDPTAPTPTSSQVATTAASTTVSLIPQTGTNTQGQTFTADVIVNTGVNTIVNADLFLTYDPSILEVIDITLGDFLPEALEIQKNIDNTNGNVSYSFYTSNANAQSGQGTIAQVSLRAKGAGTSAIAFDQSKTIIFGIGTGNVISDFNNSSRTVVAPTAVPTATPTRTPTLTPTLTPTFTPTITPTRTPTASPTVAVTATPTRTPTVTPTNAPTATITPTPVPCAITNAQWISTTNPVNEGTPVQLQVNTQGNCTGRQVSYSVFEFDLFGSDPVQNNPANAPITSGKATSSWSAEFQDDGGSFFNIQGLPEYYFNATIIGTTTTVKSDFPDLQVTKEPSLISFVLKLQGLLSALIPIDTEITLRSLTDSTQDTQTATLTQTANGTQVAEFTSTAKPGNYEVIISAPGRLRKRTPITITSDAPQIDLSNITLVAGDVNNDNVINTLDIGQTIEDYSPATQSVSLSDLTRDGYVNALDIGYIIENYFKQGD